MGADGRSKLGRISDVNFLRDQVYEILKEGIISLKLKPGDRLNVSVLAKELGASATPIREALTRLEQEGFVETIPFRGGFVTQINDCDVEEIFELRELLEGAAIKRAAITFSLEDLQKGEALLEKMREAYKVSNIKSYAKSSRDFHDLFIKKFGNQRMLNALKTFDDHLERIRITAIRTIENVPLFIEDYEKILQPLKMQNPDEAERALVAHLRRAKQIYLKSKGNKGS